MLVKEKTGKLFTKYDFSVFLTRSQASQFIRRFKRANQIFEEILPGNIERECVEETCSREEAREAFEDDQATVRLTANYITSLG